MKRFIAIAIFCITVAGCIGQSVAGSVGCYKGVCINIQALEPVRINQPITVTTTVTSDKDYSHVEIAFYGDLPGVLIEGGQGWQKGTQAEWIDIKANQIIGITRRVLIPEEGTYQVITSAMAPQFRVVNWVYILVTKDGGKVYPRGEAVPTAPFRYGATLPPEERLKGPRTPPSILGTPLPALPRSYTPIIPTPIIPTALPPTPLPPPLGFPPTPTR